jgi:tartronate-semialdehyde synthase
MRCAASAPSAQLTRPRAATASLLPARYPVRRSGCPPVRRGAPPWQSLLAIGVKKALKHTDPDAEVVGIVGDYGFQFLVEELAVAAQYNVPFVLIMLNNEYLGLIRQASIGYDMNYEVDVRYGEFGTDNVKLMEAYGCSGRRVLAPADVRPAIEWARKEAISTSRPVLVEIMIEREANTPHGISIDGVMEFEPVPEKPGNPGE